MEIPVIAMLLCLVWKWKHAWMLYLVTSWQNKQNLYYFCHVSQETEFWYINLKYFFLYNPLYCSTFFTQIIEEGPFLDKTHAKKITNYQVEFWLSEKSRFENRSYGNVINAMHLHKHFMLAVVLYLFLIMCMYLVYLVKITFC